MFVIDTALADEIVLAPIRNIASTRSLRELRLYEVVKDDRVPVLLRELSFPTFITNDEAGFWHRQLCSKAYCILYFALTDYQQEQIPSLLQRLLRLPEFKTKANRMGKVARVSQANVKYYQSADQTLRVVNWPKQ